MSVKNKIFSSLVQNKSRNHQPDHVVAELEFKLYLACAELTVALYIHTPVYHISLATTFSNKSKRYPTLMKTSIKIYFMMCLKILNTVGVIKKKKKTKPYPVNGFVLRSSLQH